LITGGAGMIGSTLAQFAVCHGAKVHIVDAMLPLYGGNHFNLSDVRDQIEFVEGDIRDAALMEQLVEDVDFVFDLAAQVSYTHSNRDPILDLDINCRGHLVVLEACRKTKANAKIIFSSSRFVYGTTKHNPVDENHPTDCRSVYGIHKLAVEKYLLFYRDAFGLDTVGVRIANPYGPRQQMKHNGYGIVNWFIRLALDAQPLTVYGDGKQKRDYVFVDDLARGLLGIAVSSATGGEMYNLGSGSGTSFWDMTKMVADSVPNTEIRQVPWPSERYFVETGDYIADLRKVCAATDWHPEVSLANGIERTMAYYAAHKKYYW
jgi:UDP-glucose 4-epimerase